MKHLKFALIALFLLSLPLGMSAQNKFGHLNSQEILALMPEVTAAQKKIDSLEQYYKDQLTAIEKDVEALYRKTQQQGFQQLPKLQQDIILEDLQQKQQRYMKVQEFASTDLQDLTQKLLEPIKQKLKDAIKAVAKEGNYTYIFDTSLGILLYASEGDDISALVKKKLGLKDAPATNNNTTPAPRR